MLEWKSDRRSLPTGQQIMYERLSATAPITVFAIIGDAQTMDITDVGVYFRGKWNDFQSSSLQDIKARIRRWVVWAQAVERRVA